MNKTEILQRLLKEDKITIEELLVLAEKEYVIQYQYLPYQPITYPQPYNLPYTITYC